MRCLSAGLLALLLLLAAPHPGQAQPASVRITFAVDMRPAAAAGWFDPAAETVGLRGSLEPLTWGQTYPAADADGDLVYEVAVVFTPRTPDAVLDYKFKVDGAGNPNDGWETGRNREVTLDGAAERVARPFDEPLPPLEPTFTGTMEVHPAFASAFLESPRALYVYLPPGYHDDPSRRYPVLYLHDGQNVFDASHAGQEWRADEHAEQLIAEGLVEPLIIVGVSNSPLRTQEYTPSARQWRAALIRIGGNRPLTDSLSALVGTYRVEGTPARRNQEADSPEETFTIMAEAGVLYGRHVQEDAPTRFVAGPGGTLTRPDSDATFHVVRDAEGRAERIVITRPPEGGLGDAYGRMLVEEVKPFIERTYRTQAGPENTGLGGSSLGGLITLYLGLQYPDEFGVLLVASPSVWWDDQMILREVEALERKTAQRIWVDMGTAEGGGMLQGARLLREALEAQGWTEGDDLHYMEENGAAHNERAWAGRFGAMLRFAFPVRE